MKSIVIPVNKLINIMMKIFKLISQLLLRQKKKLGKYSNNKILIIINNKWIRMKLKKKYCQIKLIKMIKWQQLTLIDKKLYILIKMNKIYKMINSKFPYKII